MYIYIYIYIHRPIQANTSLITYGSTCQTNTWEMCLWAFEKSLTKYVLVENNTEILELQNMCIYHILI